jgi:hypothetical protein
MSRPRLEASTSRIATIIEWHYRYTNMLGCGAGNEESVLLGGNRTPYRPTRSQSFYSVSIIILPPTKTLTIARWLL